MKCYNKSICSKQSLFMIVVLFCCTPKAEQQEQDQSAAPPHRLAKKSKFSNLRLEDGRYVMVSNPNPKKRDPLVISVSDDGVVFHKMAYLVGGRIVDYPHVIEHDGSLYVAFASAKQSVEVLKVKLSDLDHLKMPSEKIIKELDHDKTRE